MDNALWICHSHGFTQHVHANRLVSRAVAMHQTYRVLFSSACVILQNLSPDQVEANPNPLIINSLIQSDVSSLDIACKSHNLDRMHAVSMDSAVGRIANTSHVNTIYESDLSTVQGYMYMGVPIGAYAHIDLSLCRKTSDPSLYPGFYRHTIYLCTLYIEFLSSLPDKPDIVILENEYSYCKTCEHYARDQLSSKVTKYSFPTTDQRKVSFYQDQFFDTFLRRALASSPLALPEEYKSYPFAIDYIASKIVSSSSSQSYSPPVDHWRPDSRVQNFLKSHKVTIGYFSSSSDEIVSARISLANSTTSYLEKSQPFQDEYDLVAQLVAYSLRQGYGLIIRLHPRLGINPRDPLQSSELNRWESLLSEYKEHRSVYVIWPDEKINSYQVGLRVSVSVYWWSTIGIELALLGSKVLPAVYDSGTENIRYDLSSISWPNEPDSWFEILEDVIHGDAHLIFEPLHAAKLLYFSNVYGSIKDDESIFSDRNYLYNTLSFGSFWTAISLGNTTKSNMQLLAKEKLKYLLYVQYVLGSVFCVPCMSYHYNVIARSLLCCTQTSTMQG